jgi:hypothetical protein
MQQLLHMLLVQGQCQLGKQELYFQVPALTVDAQVITTLHSHLMLLVHTQLWLLHQMVLQTYRQQFGQL